MRHPNISRRSLLRGLGCTGLALPFLELMGDSTAVANAAAIQKRFVVLFAGTSLGRRYNSKASKTTDFFVPTSTGSGYEPTRSTQPLHDLGVNDVVSIVSGLKIPWTDKPGPVPPSGPVPPGGRTAGNFHTVCLSPLLSGIRSNKSRSPRGETADQIVAKALGKDAFFKSISYRAQVSYYQGGGSTTAKDGIMSYRKDGEDLIPIQPIYSPQQAFQQLFENFSPSDPKQAAELAYELDRRKKVVDFC